MIIEKERWPLHTALAWVLTRDEPFTKRFSAWPHYPCLITHDFFPDADMDWAWKELFAAMVDGRIPVFGRPTNNLKLQEKRLDAEDLKELDWANPREISAALDELPITLRNKYTSPSLVPGLRRRAAMRLYTEREFKIPDGIAFIDVHLDAAAIQEHFSSDGKPIACDSREYGAPEPATGPGYMELTSSAYLVATRSGLHNFFLRDNDEWADAYKALLSHVAQGTVEIIGRPAGKPFCQKLDGSIFSSVFIQFFLVDPAAVSTHGLPILHCTYPNSASLQKDPFFTAGSRFGGDRLIVDGKTEFSDLQVLKSDIADAFPFVEIRREKTSRSHAASSKLRPKRIYEKDAKPLYLEWIRENNLNGTISTDKEDAAYFAKHGTVGRDLRRYLRKEHAPDTWTKAGPKRRKP